MENLGLSGGLAAIAFWGFIAAVVVADYWNGVRKRDAQHETVRRIIESGQKLDEDVIDKLLLSNSGSRKRHDQDLKLTGLWLLPVSAGMAVFALVLGSAHPQTLAPLLGIAALLGVMGTGWLLAAKVAARWSKNDGSASDLHKD